METSITSYSKKENLVQNFSKLKVLIAHQLEQKYTREFAERVLKRAEKEFEKMIPQLPFF